jgi:hypothetical protein
VLGGFDAVSDVRTRFGTSNLIRTRIGADDLCEVRGQRDRGLTVAAATVPSQRGVRSLPGQPRKQFRWIRRPRFAINRCVAGKVILEACHLGFSAIARQSRAIIGATGV